MNASGTNDGLSDEHKEMREILREMFKPPAPPPPGEPRFPEGHVKLVFDDLRARAPLSYSPCLPRNYTKHQARNAFEEGFDLPPGTIEKAWLADREAMRALMFAMGKTQHGDFASDPTARAIAHNVCSNIMLAKIAYQAKTGDKLDWHEFYPEENQEAPQE